MNDNPCDNNNNPLLRINILKYCLSLTEINLEPINIYERLTTLLYVYYFIILFVILI